MAQLKTSIRLTTSMVECDYKSSGRSEYNGAMTLNKCATILLGFALSAYGSQTASPSGSHSRPPEITEGEGSVHVVVEGPRPLAQALESLQQKYKWVVDYEDPQFLSKLDLTEAQGPGKPMLPAGHQFKFDFPASGVDEGNVLQSLVDAYDASDNPGKFELRKGESDQFYAVGTQARNLKGQLSPQHPLLDAPVTLVKRKRTVEETVKLICLRAGERQHIQVIIGILPRKFTQYAPVEVGGKQIPARTLLLQALAATNRRLYWRLLFDPNTKGYIFDVHALPSS
jgi:hypothetical protein